MKTRFNTYDIVCGVTELQRLVGQRVNQVYDIDNKTYLIRLQGGEAKTMLLIESGIRFHTTAFEWPKNVAPSGFSMKLRKHLKNKRLEKLQQLGTDRIIDLQFGTGEAAYHVIVELYDRGNIILTDHDLTILYVLRPHYEGEEVRFAVREKYPMNRAKEQGDALTEDRIRELVETAASGESLRRVLMPVMDCGPVVIQHVLCKHDLDSCLVQAKAGDDAGETSVETRQQNIGGEVKKSRKQRKKELNDTNMRPFDVDSDMSTLMRAIQEANNLLMQARTENAKGYIIQKLEEKPYTAAGEVQDNFYQNIEYHPYLFAQFMGQPVSTYDSFMLAVDEFYSTLEGQKIDLKTLQQEREALKKLSNVKKDHAKRLEELNKVQEVDKQKAELITCNQALVDNAILAVRSAIANQMSWPDIHELVKAAQANGDPVASAIKQLKLEVNHISLNLNDPYHNTVGYDDNNVEDNGDDSKEEGCLPTLLVDVDLALSAWANARRYYEQKRTAAQKEQKTIDASQKALKSAERKTQQTLKDVRTISTISKARKVYWFEKFYWFISSENYLVIGGRDAQQNELIVKRYMRPTDIYVHAEIQGASSVIVRNPTGGEVAPKTLLEAGTMAISYSVAWDAKVVTTAYWVHSDQVSKTAPSGEYLGTGSFMIRGKKNFLPSCHLIMGLSLLFKLEDSFIERHRGERKMRTFEEEQQELAVQQLQQLTTNDDVEIELDPVEEADEDEDSPQAEQVLSTQEEEENNKAEVVTYFPDTQVKIEHDTGRVTVRTDSTTEATEVDDGGNDVVTRNAFDDTEEATIIPAAPSRKKQQQNAKKRKEEKERKSQKELQKQQQNVAEQQQHNSTQMKRGQKGKLKKIKSKYKDQDEEERELRMKILKSSGKDKLSGCSTDKKIEAPASVQAPAKPQHIFESKQHEQLSAAADADDADDTPTGADVAMLDALTGQPCDDDELLFVIPVVAPYQALQNYKFRVKLTPGTGKRGRAAKTALTMFSKDKSCGPREKDLLKSIKDEALARNIPGKVKLSAPQLQKLKK